MTELNNQEGFGPLLFFSESKEGIMKQHTIILLLLLNMVMLTISYISVITIGLYMLSNNVKANNVNINIHMIESASVDIKEPPIDTHEEPTVTRKIVQEAISEEPKKVIQPVSEPKPEVNNEDLKILASIINAEAGVEPYEGKIAVGNVIMNRVNHPEFPDTIKEVVYQRGQFSPVSDGSIQKEPNEDSIKAAREVLNGRRVINKNVLYFYDPRIATSKWIFTRKVVTKIGDHAFAI